MMPRLKTWLHRLFRRRRAVDFDPSGLNRHTRSIRPSDDDKQARRRDYWREYRDERDRQRGYRIPEDLPRW